MLESLMKTKTCPFISESGNADHGGPNLTFCQGSRCAVWEPREKPVVYEGGGISARKLLRWEPRDPPEGDCGMKPQAFECNYG